MDIPEFQAIGSSVGQTMAAALTNRLSVDQALQQSQNSTERFMKHTGYIEWKEGLGYVFKPGDPSQPPFLRGEN